MPDIDQPGRFYLGRRHDLAKEKTGAEPLLYDSDDLLTHAVCVGMTGSGKTGLCISLLEEAALNGVPAIAIDPKGDIGNLLLAFPDLAPADFRPWVDPAVAGRQKITLDRLAKNTSDAWRKGLAKWDEKPDRVRRFKDAVDATIYTPGSSAGVPLTVLKSFAAPAPAVLDDADALADRVQSAASGVLTLLGVDAEPATSREHILLSKVLETAWRDGRDLDLRALIHEVQQPRLNQIGAVPLDSFLPPKDRDALAMRMNNLLASPSFASWLEGEPLDVERLLYTTGADETKKPRLAIISIAHLEDAERMFLVTLLLGEVINWMRSQPGTNSLRAILYMDEVFGYFPPSANPPSKRPMLTLLKQARAYGVGCVLATQNPVDLDYKGLSNAGTWFLGRLQTERDKLRVLDGLEGASAQAGASLDRQAMEKTLAALGKRVFLMHNVHDTAPTVFETRWAMSYLAGPLTRAQIAELMKDRKAALEAASPPSIEPGVAGDRTAARPTTASAAGRPLLPAEIPQRFWPLARSSDPPVVEGSVEYRPALLGVGRVHFVKNGGSTSTARDVRVLVPVGDAIPSEPWNRAERLAACPELVTEPPVDGTFASVPGSFGEKQLFNHLARDLEERLYRNERLTRWTCGELGEKSRVNESEAEFRERVATLLQAKRREGVLKEQEAFAARLERELNAAREEYDEHRGWLWGLLANAGSRLAEILLMQGLGRRSRKQVMTASGWDRAWRSKRRAAEAKKKLALLEREIATKKQADELKLESLSRPINPASLQLTADSVAPRRSDVDVEPVTLVWLPWRTTAEGVSSPAYAPPPALAYAHTP